MTRLDLLQLVVAQARANGFQFRAWFTRYTGRPWVDAQEALRWLATGRRFYTLLFSHEFASHFWKNGEQITFSVPAQTFQRVLPNGKVITVNRRPFTRRASRPDVWKYHLREMVAAAEPLRYIRRYIRVEDELEDEASL